MKLMQISNLDKWPAFAWSWSMANFRTMDDVFLQQRFFFNLFRWCRTNLQSYANSINGISKWSL